ncbi:hypothetical protein VTN96DRAFT_7403 [Rasamsonia emersonii]
MLPKFLVGSYKRYKADTDLFTAWLVETAAKAAAADGTCVNSLYRIPLAELTTLARAVAKAAITVPSHIADVARRAISKRKQCAVWFQNRTDACSGEVQANVAHSHFINVLEEVLALLGVAVHQGPHPHVKKRSSPLSQNPLTDLENRFSALEVEESRTADEDATQRGQKAQKTQPPPRCEIDDQFEDGGAEIFESFCLLEDMRRIRDFLQATWTEYREAQIDLMTAAVTTNTAFDLVRTTCDDFMDAHPSLRGSMVLPQLMYATGCIMRGEDPGKKHHPDDPFNIAVADIAEWCLLHTTLILESFVGVIVPGSIPWFRKDFYKKRFQVKLLVEDEFTGGIRDMVKTKHVPVWLAFAAPVILDTHRILGPNISQPFQELRLTGLRTKKTLDGVSQRSLSMIRLTWPTCDKDMRRFTDTVYGAVTDDMFAIAPKEAPRDEEFSFLKTHPILCGLLMFSFNLNMQQMGIPHVNSWGSVVSLAYLYNLIQQTGFEPLYWEDMEKVIEFHDEKHIFIGGKPKDVNDTYKKLWLAMGFAPSSFAPKGQRKMMDRPLKKVTPRLLKTTSVVAAVFQERYCGSGSIDLSARNVGQILDDLVENRGKCKNDGFAKDCGVIRRKWTVANSLSTLQLLTALRERLADEEPKLLFNYFGLKERCLDLLQGLQKELDGKLVQYFGSAYLKDEKDLSLIVSYILEVAHGSARSARSLGFAKGSARVMSKMVMRAANVMQDFVKGNGGVGCKELRAFCRQKGKVMSQADKTRESKRETLYWFAVDELIDLKELSMLELMLSARLQKEYEKNPWAS